MVPLASVKTPEPASVPEFKSAVFVMLMAAEPASVPLFIVRLARLCGEPWLKLTVPAVIVVSSMA